MIENNRAEYVLIVSGDQVYQMDYAELLRRHVTSGADLTIAAVEYPVGRAASLGVIEVDSGGRIVMARSIGWYAGGRPEGFIVSVLGAILLLALYRVIKPRRDARQGGASKAA